MTNIKLDMDRNAVQRFLEVTYNDGEITELEAAPQGEISRVYFFKLNGRPCVIRMNRSGEGFEREQFLYRRLGQDIPIPALLRTGTFEHGYYAISKRASGRSLMHYKPDQIAKLLPQLAQITARLHHATGHEDLRGWGTIDSAGQGNAASWQRYLASLFEEEQSGFWQNWTELFRDSFLERELFDRLFDRMMNLAVYHPERRSLVHGDLFLDNIMSDGDEITAVIDWEMAMLGDCVFDLAVWELWCPQLEYPSLYKQHCEAQGISLPHYRQRMDTAILWKGLDALRFYAKKGDRGAYDQIRSKLLPYA